MFRTVSPESVGISSKEVLKFIQTLDRYHFCTHSFIMARGMDIFAEGYYAPFHKDFKHRMYSVSKSFVSVAVGLAVEDGLLGLETPRRCKLSIVKIINRDCSEWSDTPQRPAGYLPAEHRMADGVPPEKVDLYELQRHQK